MADIYDFPRTPEKDDYDEWTTEEVVHWIWMSTWLGMNIRGPFCYTGYGPINAITKPWWLKLWHGVTKGFKENENAKFTRLKKDCGVKNLFEISRKAR